jgi:hypothetical protein
MAGRGNAGLKATATIVNPINDAAANEGFEWLN